MSDDPYKVYREYYENMYRAFAEQLTGQVFATSTSGWAHIPGPATQPVVYHGHGLGPEGVAKARAAQVGAVARAGAVHEQIRRRAQFGRDYLAERMAQSEKTEAKPEPPPEPTHCGCGASFATVKRFTPYTGMDLCGDCYSAPRPQAPAPIDARIRDAREGRVEDPTTWTAGATPGWEWP